MPVTASLTAPQIIRRNRMSASLLAPCNLHDAYAFMSLLLSGTGAVNKVRQIDIALLPRIPPPTRVPCTPRADFVL